MAPKKYHKNQQNQAFKQNPDPSIGATRTKPCHRCGETNHHGPETCIFCNANCNYYRRGHIVAACFVKKKSMHYFEEKQSTYEDVDQVEKHRYQEPYYYLELEKIGKNQYDNRGVSNTS